jgi:FADH2 O2-dependent halogenase
MIDRSGHPRFAIGESSTPTADFLLAHIADRWGLSELAPLACWGSWKSRYPEVVCGKKRGFSYYRHFPGRIFCDTSQHEHSLLVAASVSDEWSDTHWLRSSVDQFLVQKAQAAGAELMEGWSLSHAVYDQAECVWDIQIAPVDPTDPSSQKLVSRWIIDASGAGNALAPFVGNPSDDQWMQTRTGAIFAHYEGVKLFEEAHWDDDPFRGDDAAQHHLLDSGWCWMLRMDNGITSVGLVEPTDEQSHSFQETVDRYPSVANLLSEARRVMPRDDFGRIKRLSRCRARCVGPGWVLMPVTYGFVDPLHSSGIAHALSGVVRVAEALLADDRACRNLLDRYAVDLRCETEWLDCLVSGCYAAQPSFDRIVAFASFYFMAAIGFERQMAADPSQWPSGFLQCRDRAFTDVVRLHRRFLDRLEESGPEADRRFVSSVREGIAPWNRVGLLDPSSRNRLAHSAAPKYASIAASSSGGMSAGSS